MKILLAAAVLGCLAACNRDGLQNDIPGSEGGSGEFRFIAVTLNSTDGTTLGLPSFSGLDDYVPDGNPFEGDKGPTIDGVFNPGNAVESAICPNADAHAALLFNEDGSWYGRGGLELSEVLPENRVVWVMQFESQETLPAKMLVVLNADPDYLKDDLIPELEKEDNALSLARQWIIEGGEDGKSPALYYYKKDDENEGKNYFTMTSSVYGVHSDTTAEIALTAPYDERDLADYVYAEPEKAIGDPLTLYVERMAAKFTVTFVNEDGDAYLTSGEPFFIEPKDRKKVSYIKDWAIDPESDEVKLIGEEGDWKIHIVNWGINGVEPNTFLFKNMTNEPGGESVDGSFAKELWWNTLTPKENPRSYWAVDQHYEHREGEDQSQFGETRRANRYPGQFRIAWDKGEETIEFYQTEAEDGTYEYKRKDWALDYYSFADFGGQTRTVSKYALENTFNPAALSSDLKNDGHLRVGSHIILAAQLVIDGYEGEDFDEKELGEGNLLNVKDKYYNGAEFMTGDAFVSWAAYTLASQLTVKPRTVHLLKEIDGETSREFTAKDSQFYGTRPGVDDPEKITSENAGKYFEIVPAQIKGGDGWATINVIDKCQIYVEPADSKDEDDVENKDNVENKDDVEQVDMQEITKYIPSLVYDLIKPVRAYSKGRMYYAIPVLHEKQFTDGKFDASNLKVGDVGVVRNHWYRVKVRSINALGTPVHDPEQPIIPNHEPEFKSLGVQIEILPWTRIKMDDVIL